MCAFGHYVVYKSLYVEQRPLDCYTCTSINKKSKIVWMYCILYIQAHPQNLTLLITTAMTEHIYMYLYNIKYFVFFFSTCVKELFRMKHKILRIRNIVCCIFRIVFFLLIF